MKSLSKLLLFILFLAQALTTQKAIAQDYSSMKRDFDNMIQSRTEATLVSILPHDQFSVIVYSQYNPQAISKKTTIELPKLNMETRSPNESNEIENIPPFEQLVSNVKIYIRTKSAISSQEQDSIQKLLSPALDNLGKFKKTIEFETLPILTSNITPEKTPVADRTWLYIAVALIFCSMISAAIYMGSKNFTNQVTVQPQANSQDSFSTDSTSFSKNENTEQETKQNESRPNPKAGTLRWKKFVDLELKTAAMGLSRWTLSQDETDHKLAVYACSQLSLTSIKKMIPLLENEVKEFLTQKSRDLIIDKELFDLDNRLLSEVNSFLFEESHDEVSTDSFFVDFTPQEIALLLKQGNKYSKLLTQHLNPLRLTRAIQMLSAKEVGQLFGAFQEDTNTDEKKLALEARTLIVEIRKNRPNIHEHPFAKLLQTLKDLTFEQEEQIYQGLVEYGNEELVKNAAVQTYPLFLIEKLPLDLLKQTIGSFTLNERVEVLLCVSETLQERILLSLESQPKLKDALASQMYDLKNSPQELEMITKNRDRTLRTWSQRVQKIVKSTESYKRESLVIVDEWYKVLKNNLEESKNAKAS